jgi:acetylglutamate kinase
MTATSGEIRASFPAITGLIGKTVVVKYGGSAMEREETREGVCREVASLHQLGIKIVVVHGGGSEISRMMERVGLKPIFLDGLRVTDSEGMRITEMVLSGTINSDLVSRITRSGAPAIGMSGRDAHLLKGLRLKGKAGEDLGNTGEVTTVAANSIIAILDGGFVPVVSPVAETMDGEPLNVNADYAAAALAGALSAEACIFLTDVPGIKKNGEIIPTLSRLESKRWIEDGTIYGGMIPKVECALRALKEGARRAVICDAARPFVISATLCGDALSGTSITP